MRLIDATPLECQAKEGMGNEWNHRAAPTSWAHAEERFLNRIEDAPTVDAVPVVRCKECKHFKNYGKTSLLIDGKNIKAGWCHRRARYDEEYRMPPDGFCSYGEPRMDGGADHDA